MNTPESLQQIFQEVQRCNIIEYKNYLKKAVQIVTDSAVFQPIIHVLLQCNKNTLPGRITRFLQQIFEELHRSDPATLRGIFDYLMTFCSSRSTKARKHALQLLYSIISVACYELATETLQVLVERLFDKETSVRREALKISLFYQECSIADGLTIQATLKDVIRHDTAAEMRKAAISGIKSTLAMQNCIIERAIDSSVAVRKTFWVQAFPRVLLYDIPRHQCIFLMVAAFLERDFDAFELFVSFAKHLPIEKVADLFYSSVPAYDLLLKACLEQSIDVPFPEILTEASIRLLRLHYKRIEEQQGREALNLRPLDEILGLILKCCADNSTNIIVELFMLLKLYDIFNEESCNLVADVLRQILTRYAIPEMIEEGIVLAQRVLSRNLIPFIREIIGNIDGQHLFMVCEAVMKHLPFDKLQEGILNDIALSNLPETASILFWYLVKKSDAHILEVYLSILPDAQVLKGATDLVLKGLLDIDRISDMLEERLRIMDWHAAEPTTKLFLASKIKEGKQTLFFEYLMLLYYCTDSAETQQILVVFFSEYVSLCPEPLISVFCPVLERITANHRVFVDQTLYWISKTKIPSRIAQELYYFICFFIQKNYNSLKNKKYLFLALEQINVDDSWDSKLLKKIIALVSLIIRRRPKENAQLLLTRLISIDDGVPMDPEEHLSLMKDIEEELSH